MNITKAELEYFLELSAAAYTKTFPIRIHNDEKIYKIDDPQSGIKAYIIVKLKKLTIIFKGTSSLNDGIIDLTFARKSIPYNNSKSNIRVHSGFLEAYSSKNVRNIIHTFITPEIKHIITTGHSYGAALAQLCAVDIQYNFPDCDIESVQFGCPRIGNYAYAKSYNYRIFKSFRVVNGNDLVTKIAPYILGFRHTGIKIHIGCMNIPFIYSATAHYPQSYYENLIKMKI